jgi:hypothetical protein
MLYINTCARRENDERRLLVLSDDAVGRVLDLYATKRRRRAGLGFNGERVGSLLRKNASGVLQQLDLLVTVIRDGGDDLEVLNVNSIARAYGNVKCWTDVTIDEFNPPETVSERLGVAAAVATERTGAERARE